MNRTLAEIKTCDDKAVQFEEEGLAREVEMQRIAKQAKKKRERVGEIEKEIIKLERSLQKAKENLDRLGPDNTEEIQVTLDFEGS